MFEFYGVRRLRGAVLVSICLHLGVIGSALRLSANSSDQWTLNATDLLGYPGELSVLLKIRRNNGAENVSARRVSAATRRDSGPATDILHEDIVFPARTTENDGRSSPAYFPSGVLQRSPVPISAPDAQKYLSAIDLPSIPLRLRLYIDARGRVNSIETFFQNELSEAEISAVKEMFLATTFIPGYLEGRDVPSYLDIEFALVEQPAVTWE